MLTTSTSTSFFSFFFTATATTEIYTLSLHDALPILDDDPSLANAFASDGFTPLHLAAFFGKTESTRILVQDRKSTRLNSSHRCISYAVFCLKKKNTIESVQTLSRNICIVGLKRQMQL